MADVVLKMTEEQAEMLMRVLVDWLRLTNGQT